MGRKGGKLRDDEEPLGQYLARIRRARGLTQIQLANDLGVPQPMVSNYERGELRLHGHLIVRLAKILDVSADELLGLKATAQAADSEVVRPFLRRLRRLDRLSKRQRKALLMTIDAFLQKAS